MTLRNSFSFKSKLLIISASVILLAAIALFFWWWNRPPKPFARVTTVAGTGLKLRGGGLPDYFGVAVDDQDRIYFSDGTANSIFRIEQDGSLKTITSELDMPSAIAFDPDGSLVVANTGAHTIVQIDVESGRVQLIAGSPGISGDLDGTISEARFNGPIGVAVGSDGRIFVADTYNDCIREIGKNGKVRTIAGSTTGFRDGKGSEVQFDTPCGIALAPDNSLLVADTGNNRIRYIVGDEYVTTFAGNGEADSRDGHFIDSAFNEPISIAIRRDGKVFVTDAGSSSIRVINAESDWGEVVRETAFVVSIPFESQDKREPFESQHKREFEAMRKQLEEEANRTNIQSNRALIKTTVATVAGGFSSGLVDDEPAKSKLNRPTSLAFNSSDALIFADNGNGLIRVLVPEGLELGRKPSQEAAIIRAEEIRKSVPPRWPFDPPQAKRDIAGTFGEIRGEMLPEHDAWFHNGLDIPGAYGETARAIFSERVTLPMAVEAAGTGRERLRLPLIGYIHVSIGRDRDDQSIGNFPEGAITLGRDEQGQIDSVRVRRGTRFNAGDAIGTLNRLHHVHLVAGPAGGEINALAALQFPGLVDTVPPTIEGVMIFNEQNEMLFDSSARQKKPAPVAVGGKLRIVVRAYDQVDGNPRYRRLGLFGAGYRVLRAGEPLDKAQQTPYSLIFERLPLDPDAVRTVYAGRSQSGYEGPTVFGYIVTNTLRDGEAREGFLKTSELAPGDYVLRVFVRDYFGNQAQRDVPIAVIKE